MAFKTPVITSPVPGSEVPEEFTINWQGEDRGFVDVHERTNLICAEVFILPNVAPRPCATNCSILVKVRWSWMFTRELSCRRLKSSVSFPWALTRLRCRQSFVLARRALLTPSFPSLVQRR